MKSIAEIAANYINKITEAMEHNADGLKGMTEFIKPIWKKRHWKRYQSF